MSILLWLNRLTLYSIALVGVLYLVLVAINWSDRPPSPTTLEFATSLNDRVPAADEANAYLFMMGFSGSPEIDPAQLGRERRDWFVEAHAHGEADRSADPLPAAYEYRSDRSSDVADLAGACGESEASCLEALVLTPPAAEKWLASEKWLLDRYVELISYASYQETILFDVDAPYPSYSVIFDGQRLLLITASFTARDGRVDRAMDLLDDDLAFWRMVLRNSDALISKLIAAAAITRHFKFGNEILRELYASTHDDTIPGSWLKEIDDEERSMRRTLIGEWAFMDNVMQSMRSDFERAPTADYGSDGDVWDRAKWRLFLPLYQPQDYSNRHAEMMAQYIDLFDTPYPEVPAAHEEAASIIDNGPKPFNRAYNVVGDWLFSIGQPDFADYAVRVADLEGIRRAAVVTSLLRARGVTADETNSSLGESELRDPYTDKSFAWMSESQEVVFNGLAANDRGEHRFRY